MKQMKIYEPAMCCPTGLCGVGVDPELLRISTVLNTLKQNGFEVPRYNLTGAPAEFVKSKVVTEFLQKFGPDKLPVVLVDDFIVIAGRYPTNEEFASWLELPANVLGTSCCEGESCCCGDAPAEDSCCRGGDSADKSCCTPDCCADGAQPEGCCTGEEPCCTPDCCSDGVKPEGCCETAPEQEGGCCCGDGCC